jgi:cytochrome o ubiquinol oxidase subunit 3
MSDCVLFACLFAAYAVLHTATGAGPSSIEIFDRSFVLIETLVLLASSFTCGLALLAARRGSTAGTWVALLSTLALGATFLGMEFHEFSALVASGASWQASAFLSSYFTLVGTHGLHIVIGLLWLLILCLHIAIVGVQKQTVNNLLYFSLFWHFLDIVWICIFSFVYLFGSLPV